MAKKDYHFRIDTVALLHEIIDNALIKNHGVLRVPINTLRILLAQVAQRCAEINDPVLNRLMFDLTLYELPKPTSPEYSKMMESVYEAEKKFLTKSKKTAK